MVKARFYTVHKNFAQETPEGGTIYGHEEYYGLDENQAKAKYHELLASVYAYSDPWSNVFIKRDDGVEIFGEVVDRRTAPEPTQED